MRTFIAAILLVSVAATANAQASPDGEAACKANHSGNLLLTTAEYTNGYKVEAPWRVLSSTTQTRRARVTATLEYIVETDPVTGKRQRTALPARWWSCSCGCTSRRKCCYWARSSLVPTRSALALPSARVSRRSWSWRSSPAAERTRDERPLTSQLASFFV